MGRVDGETEVIRPVAAVEEHRVTRDLVRLHRCRLLQPWRGQETYVIQFDGRLAEVKRGQVTKKKLMDRQVVPGQNLPLQLAINLEKAMHINAFCETSSAL